MDKLNALNSQMQILSTKKVNFDKLKDSDGDASVRRLENELGDLKYELNHLQRDVELRKDQEYRRLLDIQADNKNANHSNNSNHPNSNQSSGRTFSNFKPSNLITCFHCKQQGHRYHQCSKASKAEKEEISKNFNTYLAAYKDSQKHERSPLNPGVATSSQ